MMYGNTLNPYGLRDGKVVYVENLNPETEFGLKCNCTCPHCGRPLVAKINGKKREKHFAHQGGSDCGKAYESAIHRLAKEVIEEDGVSVMIPRAVSSLVDGGCFVVDGTVKYNSVLSEQMLITPDSGRTRIEEDRKSIRPDVIIEKDGRELFIEILVTHAVGEEKKQKIRELGISCIEIDFSYYKGTVITREQIAQALKGEDPNVQIRWIYNKQIEKRDLEMKAILSKLSVLKANNISVEKETPLSVLGFEHVVNHNRTVMNCPNRKEYYPNYYYSSLSDCTKCEWHRGSISALQSDIVNYVLCAKGDDRVRVKTEDICIWLIDTANNCRVLDSEEMCVNYAKSFFGKYRELKSVVSDPKIKEAVSKVEGILMDAFNEKKESEGLQRKIAQLKNLDRTVCIELNKLIFSADTTFDDWKSTTFDEAIIRTLQPGECDCLDEKEINAVFVKRAKEIWDGHSEEAKNLYKVNASFRKLIEYYMKNPKLEGETDSQWLQRTLNSFRKPDGSLRRCILNNKSRYPEISICPFMALLLKTEEPANDSVRLICQIQTKTD